MQKFTRNITREITVGGERLALTLSEEGLSIRAVGTRRAPLQLSWAAALVSASKQVNEPPADEVTAVLETMVPSGRKPGSDEGKPAPKPEPVLAGVNAGSAEAVEDSTPASEPAASESAAEHVEPSANEPTEQAPQM